jgi:hypothetical protein
MSSSRAEPASNHATSTRPVIKKRKIRKGTVSCWECKNRKTRCEFTSGSICVFCQRRGLSCTSQELPDPLDNGSVEIEERLGQAETLASQLVEQRRLRLPTGSRTTHDVGEIADERTAITDKTNASDLRNGNRAYHLSLTTSIRESPSANLLSALPKPGVAALIFNRGNYFSLPFHLRQQLGRKPQTSVSNAEQLVQVSKLPKPTDHPVHFARKLIQLALSLQELDASDMPDLRLDQPVHDAAQRFVDTASSHVTSDDSLVDSLDGLETLMLEACYRINSGNLRGAWLTFRRALAIAQLVDLPRLAERAGTREESLWFRLMYGDRFLSLIIGLPHAITDNDFIKKYLVATGLPTENLDRVHFVVLGRIIARNVRLQRSRRDNNDAISKAGDHDDCEETRDIDSELKKVARQLTLKWWAFSSLNKSINDMEATERTGKLVAQMHHYFLLTILHLPILIQKLPAGPISGNTTPASHVFGHTYSETTVLAASREVLTRFVALRDLHRTLSYRALDDKAVIAGVGLVLAHLTGHRHGLENALDHQRPYDLGLVYKTIDTMKRGSCFDRNVLGRKDITMLEALLETEADAADGNGCFMWMDEDAVEEHGYRGTTMEDGLRLPIPFFGILHVHRQESQRAQPPEPAPATTDTVQSIAHPPANADGIPSSGLFHLDQAENTVDFLYHTMNNTFFDHWIPGQIEMDETIFDIGI